MANSSPVVVYYKSQTCRFCTQLDAKWGKETDVDNSTVLGAMKQVCPKLRTFVISSNDSNGTFDENAVPSDMRRWAKWFPMILLVPGRIWDNAMLTLGPGNPASVIDGVQILNGMKGTNGEIIYQSTYDGQTPEGIAKWLTDALNDEEFKRHRLEYINKPIHCDIGAGLYQMLLNDEFTDIVIRLDDDSQVKAHGLVLAAASDYFKGQILRFFNPIISIDKVLPCTFRRYLDFVYGQTLEFEDWRQKFDLFDFMNYTKTLWPTKKEDVTIVKIGRGEFLEYFDRVAKLYDYEVPEDVIYAMAVHIHDLVDLSPLGEETMKILLNSEYLYCGPTKLIDYMRQLGVDAVM
jgi:hypothetical protein